MDTEYLLQRIAKLERSQKRVRNVGFAAVIVVATMTFMAQIGVPAASVRAQEFVVVDKAGRSLATIGGAPLGPEGGIHISDGNHKPMLDLWRIASTTYLTVNNAEPTSSGLALSLRRGSLELKTFSPTSRVDISATEEAAILAVAGRDWSSVRVAPKPQKPLTGNAVNDVQSQDYALLDAKPIASLDAYSDKASLSIEDAQGFETSVGISQIGNNRTGQKTSTSAASILMFGRDKTVIWHAP